MYYVLSDFMYTGFSYEPDYVQYIAINHASGPKYRLKYTNISPDKMPLYTQCHAVHTDMHTRIDGLSLNPQ